jgi:NTE family protein
VKPKTRIAIACQGGGSQTAFTAGALKALSDACIGEEFDVVGISGTSGGAVCAALLWFAYLKGERPIWTRLIDFWRENAAQGWAEHAFNHVVTESIRLVHTGLLPAFQISPSSPLARSMMQFATLGLRKEFTDFPALLCTHIDFDEIASWGPRADRPALIIGAANITSGKLAKFVSTRETIRLEHILASCAVPSIFPAVQIGADAYWDGLFSDNPPVEELLHARSVGMNNIPEEIWLIKINPTARQLVPTRPVDILDRRNQIEGNISLFHQLTHIETLNDLILAGAIRPEFLARFDISAQVRIPKSFSDDPDKPYHIPWIEMSADLQATLDYEGKINRSSRTIELLMAEGERSALEFLRERASIVAANSA